LDENNYETNYFVRKIDEDNYFESNFVQFQICVILIFLMKKSKSGKQQIAQNSIKKIIFINFLTK